MKISLNTSTTKILKLRVETNTDVSTFHFSVTGLPIKAVTCSDATHSVDFNGDKVIVWGKTVIPNGDLLTIEFTTPQNYGTYPIVLTPLSAATTSAISAQVTKGADGVIAMTFSEAQLLATVAHIIGKGTSGVNIDGDGDIDCVDVQLIINNLG